MKWLASAALLGLFLQDAVHDHGRRGAARAVDLDAVARNHAALAKLARRAIDRAAVVAVEPPAPPYPACRGRSVRRVAVTDLPEDLPVLWFGRPGRRAPEGAVDMGAGDDGGKLGVRCAPTTLRRTGPAEVELVEGD